MPHRHSRKKREEKRLRRQQQLSKREKEHILLLNYSQHDPLNGEIIHTEHTEPIVYNKIKVNVGDGHNMVCAHLEYGQLLNRFSPSNEPRFFIGNMWRYPK